MRKLTLVAVLVLFVGAPALAGIDFEDDIKPMDDIVRGVPEPTSALLMVAGMATVGLALRRRQ